MNGRRIHQRCHSVNLIRLRNFFEMPKVQVCQGGACSRRGAGAVLEEIEELAQHYGLINDSISNSSSSYGDDLTIVSSSCLSLCQQGPAARVTPRRTRTRQRNRQRNARGGKYIYFTHIDSLQVSEDILAQATGAAIDASSSSSLDPVLKRRLARARLIRARDEALKVYRYNEALQIAEQLQNQTDADDDDNSLPALMARAGFPKGRITDNDAILTTPQSIDIENYSPWLLTKITPVSKHSAIFSLNCQNVDRGSPHPRNDETATISTNTWHITLLAHVGMHSNASPLPWIERDYTPISSAKEWDQDGTCDLLIKLYHPHGRATSWLYDTFVEGSHDNTKPEKKKKLLRQPKKQQYIWLSKPLPTLLVPYLKDRETFRPQSVLLVLAGTGIVALPQIMQHRYPTEKLGIETTSTTTTSSQQHLNNVPIDLIYSCRADDVLMLEEIAQWCQEGHQFATTAPPRTPVVKGLRQCTLLLTEPVTESDDSTNKSSNKPTIPFPEFQSSAESPQDLLQHLPNVQVLQKQRLNQMLISEAARNQTLPCRTVISGPAAFNETAKSLLVAASVDENSITVLEA